MRRVLPAFSASLLSLGLVAGPAAAQDDGLDRIEMPNGWAPEGITTDGEMLYAGSLANGAILAADPSTGTTEVLFEGAEGLVVAGIEYDDGRLWAAGANGGEVRAYDAETGELLATYPFEAGFLNDVVATDDAVYVSDSFVPQVAVIPLGEDGALADPADAYVLPISGDLEYGEGFNANGIVAAPAGLVLVHSGLGQLYRVDPASGESSLIDTGGAELTAGDGLELVDQTLYVMRNRLGPSVVGEIVAVELDDELASGSVVGTVSSDDWDVSTTVAAIGDDLWSVNARFGTDPTPETEYWMSRVDAPTATEG
jgi:outer membrane protein assembly factor BamB